MGQIAKLDTTTTGQLTRWSAPLLDAKLSGLLTNYTSLVDSPVIGPKSAAALQAFVDAQAQPTPPRREDVETMLGLFATAGKRRRQSSEIEAAAQLDLYWRALSDLPLEDLRFAYDKLMKESPWFPDISDIRKAATGGPVTAHQRRRSIAKALIGKHQREWEPPCDVITPEEAAKVREMIEGAAATSAPTTHERDRRD